MHLPRLSILLLAMAGLCASAFAAPIPARSTLTAATVYPDRAVVTRVATGVELPAGVSELTFAALPVSLLDDSVQVSAKGTAAAALLDIATRTTHVAVEPDARVKTLEDQLDALRREEGTLNDQLSRLGAQRALLDKIETASTTPPTAPVGATPPPRPSLDEYEKLLAFSDTQRARLDESAQKLNAARTALQSEIAAAQSQLNELRGKQRSGRAQKTVTVRLSADAAGKLDVTLSYA